MDNLFVLYRYLVQSRSRTNEDSNYNIALRALENVLNIIIELEPSAQMVKDNGGFDWEQAERLRDRIIEGHQVGLVDHYGTVKEMFVALAEKYLPLTDFDFVITDLERMKQAAIARQSLDDLGEIDEHPF